MNDTSDLFESENAGSAIVGSKIYLSISTLATEFGCARETLRNRLNDAGVQPAKHMNGHPLYALRDALRVWLTGPDADPNKLQPHARLAYFKAQSERLKVDLEMGNLIQVEDHDLEVARILKVVAMELDTLVDEVERDIGASPLVLQRIESKVDVIRERMYEGIVNPVQPTTDAVPQ